MKKKWFEDWFNTSEYLEVYKHRNEQDAELHINFILSKIELIPNSSIIDMACGAGRHSILLAKKGYNVTGIDISEILLSEAVRNVNGENLNIEFIKSDIRQFNANKKYELALNLFTSFGYFEKDEENFLVFEKAFEFLNDSGFFVFDFFNKNYLLRNLVPLTKEFSGGKEIIQKRFVRKGRIEKIIEIIDSTGKKTFTESVKLYSVEQLKYKLLEIGFEIVSVFGDFNGSNFEVDSSPRFLAICKK